MQRPDGPSDFDLDELERAVRYQEWVAAAVAPWMGSRILEIGSGTGNMSRWLPRRDRLILTEPDDRLRAVLAERSAGWRADPGVVSIAAFSPESDAGAALADEGIDTIVSFNVMEHIRDDYGTLRNLAALLGTAPPSSSKKRLVMFVPAHPWAFGTLDAAFHHERRYSGSGLRRLLTSVAPNATVSVRYFNLVGLPGWLIAGRLLRRRSITPSAVRAFEAICPVVRPIDDFLHRRLGIPLGQSLIGVAEWA